MFPARFAAFLTFPSLAVAVLSRSPAMATAGLLASAALALSAAIAIGMRTTEALAAGRGGAFAGAMGIAAGHALAMAVGGLGADRVLPAFVLGLVAGAAGGIAGASLRDHLDSRRPRLH